MKKKILATLLVMTMIVGLLSVAGCGSKKTKINIVRALFNLEAVDEGQVKKVEDEINKYLNEKGCDFEVSIREIMSGEYVEKAGNAVANKEVNLLWTASWEEGKIKTSALVANGMVKDISKLLPDTALYNSMDAGQWEATKFDGKNYFVPVYKDNVEGYDLMYRKEVVDKLGVDVTKISKLQDLEPVLAQFKAEGLKYPFLLQKGAMFWRFYIDKFDFFTGEAESNFVAVDRASDSVVFTLDTPEYKEFADLIADWRDKGYVHEDEYTKVVTDQTTQSKDWGVSWWTDTPNNAEANNRYGQDVVINPLTQRWAHSNSALGSCYCVTANTNDKQAKQCIEFLGLLYTDKKLADLYTYGIQGEDWSVDENGQVVKSGKKYNHSMWESVSALVITPEAGSPADFAGAYKQFNGTAQTSCAAGFRFDESAVSAEYTACKALHAEYGFLLETGGVAKADVDAKIAEYKSALQAAGVQKVIDEFTKQYNDFKSKK
ncbi:MAG: ABC transporter substrate-binding protein [Lachnospiraceae bacterium]|nr:ABC transporter substrate-binding protein [Lachnospiraceae bacterium]